MPVFSAPQNETLKLYISKILREPRKQIDYWVDKAKGGHYSYDVNE